MKQYNKVYVPDQEGELEIYNVDGSFEEPASVFLAPPDSTIVLTLKEAEDIWDAGARGDRMKNVPDAKYTNFKSWMEYKGVKI